jgi:hypothetical protein
MSKFKAKRLRQAAGQGELKPAPPPPIPLERRPHLHEGHQQQQPSILGSPVVPVGFVMTKALPVMGRFDSAPMVLGGAAPWAALATAPAAGGGEVVTENSTADATLRCGI